MSWRILQGDCREVLRTLPAESVDLCIADPPYGETKLDWDRHVHGWLPEVRRVLKPSGSLWCFGSLRFFMERVEDFAGWALIQDVVWEKHNGSNSAADRFRRVHELAAHFRPADRPWAGVYHDPQTTADATARAVRRMRSVIYARSPHGRAIHPTQKPEPVLEPLVRYSCPPGGLVLDPFTGSGSSGIAAVRQGRRFIGVELDAEMAAEARAWLAADAPLLNTQAGRVA